MKHTKGPWELIKKDSDFYEIPKINIQLINLWNETENAANARLIAAAPELLQGFKSMLSFIESYGGDVTANFAGDKNENLKWYKDILNKVNREIDSKN